MFGKHPFFKMALKGLPSLVPRGFLKFYVLRLLEEKEMSGAEIMGEIERRTMGLWRPSPGSIYPLLSWLSDEGYISVSSEERGAKRYKLTEKGKDFLREYRDWVRKHVKGREPALNRRAFVWPPLIPLLLAFSLGENESIPSLLKEMFDNILMLRVKMEEKSVRGALDDFSKALSEFNEKLRNIIKKYWGA